MEACPTSSSAAYGAREEDRWPVRGGPAPSFRILDRAPGHPDEGMKPAVGEVLEALNLLETGPLVHGDRPAVERRHDQGVALRPERRRGEPQAGAEERLTQPVAGKARPQSQ